MQQLPKDWIGVLKRYIPDEPPSGFLEARPPERYDMLMDMLCAHCQPQVLPANVDAVNVFNTVADRFTREVLPVTKDGKPAQEVKLVSIPHDDIYRAIWALRPRNPREVFLKVKTIIQEILN